MENRACDTLTDEEFFWLVDQINDSKEDHFKHTTLSLYAGHQAGILYGVFQNDVQLPAFILVGSCVNGREALMLWVHPFIRRQGIGRLMIKEMHITHAEDFLPGSEEFWETVLR